MRSQSSNQAIQFFKSLVIVMLGVILCDQLIGRSLQYLYNRQRTGLLYRTSFSIDSTCAEYIVVGSSRANHDYDPKIFEDKLKVTFYNCGRDKQGIIYSCAIISGILERYKPKFIIIDVRPDEFSQSDEGTLSTILPYQSNKAVAGYFRYNSKFENVKLLSKIYPYNSLLTNLIVGLDTNRNNGYNGFIKLINSDENSPLETLKEPLKPDTVKIKVVAQLLKKISNYKIPVMLVISPIRYKYISSVTAGECKKLSSSYPNVRFLNFTNISAWENYKLYSDNNHLNLNGADAYSAALSSQMR